MPVRTTVGASVAGIEATCTTAGGTEFATRPCTARDEGFLYALYADRRSQELGATGWDGATSAAFLDMQFRAQQAGYALDWADADHRLILVDGAPVGRVLVARRPSAHVLVDVVLLAGVRGRGIGTALVEQIQSTAAGAGVGVDLHVSAWDDRVLRWYERLGFRATGHTETHVAMTWGGRGG